MIQESDAKVLVVFAVIGLVVTAPIWVPLYVASWVWERIVGATRPHRSPTGKDDT